MRTTLAIASRELSSLFRLPVGWVVIALYALLTGCVFSLVILVPGQAATMRMFFAVSGWVLLPVVPAVSMRLLSEEYRSGTIEPLLTSPVSDAAVIAGKYLGACAFLVLMFVPTLIHVVILVSLSDPRPDAGPIVAGYLSLALVGALYLSVGLLVSSLTANQTLAFLATLFLLLLIVTAGLVSLERVPAWARPVLGAVSIRARLDDFAKGVIDTSHIVFFLGASAWFVTLAALCLQSRRWR